MNFRSNSILFCLLIGACLSFQSVFGSVLPQQVQSQDSPQSWNLIDDSSDDLGIGIPGVHAFADALDAEQVDAEPENEPEPENACDTSKLPFRTRYNRLVQNTNKYIQEFTKRLIANLDGFQEFIIQVHDNFHVDGSHD